MSAETSYKDLIQAHVASAGLAPTPEQVEAADALLRGRIVTFSTGLMMVDGEITSPTAAVAHACGWFPKVPAPSAPVTPPEPPPPPAPPSRFTGQTAAALARAAGNGATVAQAAHDAEHVAFARKLAGGPNPFLATGNHTHRAIIRKYLPDVAAELQSKVIR